MQSTGARPRPSAIPPPRVSPHPPLCPGSGGTRARIPAALGSSGSAARWTFRQGVHSISAVHVVRRPGDRALSPKCMRFPSPSVHFPGYPRPRQKRAPLSCFWWNRERCRGMMRLQPLGMLPSSTPARSWRSGPKRRERPVMRRHLSEEAGARAEDGSALIVTLALVLALTILSRHSVAGDPR